MKEVSNWGRWGPDDEMGASNLITPAKRKQAAALVKEGISVSLAHDVIQEDAPDARRCDAALHGPVEAPRRARALEAVGGVCRLPG